MAFTCPNKSHPNYKKLVKYLGETGAMIAYQFSNNEIPDYTKAPNGEDSIFFEKVKKDFNEEAAYIAKFKTQTNEFKQWFKGSKIIDKNGEPRVLYHGSGQKFEAFDASKARSGTLGKGFYFTPDKKEAIRYANVKEGGFNVYPVFLKANNVKETNVSDTGRDLLELMKIYDDSNFNGVMSYESSSKDDLYIVSIKNPNQIKSLGNEGTFDSSDNIYQQKSSTSEETLDNFERKRQILSNSLNADVELDTSIEGAGQLVTGKDTPSIKVNPNYFGGDTLIHEYGHLYIDLLGGMSNSMIQQGRKYLNNTELEERVKNLYPELVGEKLDKEILSTAIGMEGEQIFDASQGNVLQRFNNWLNLFFNRIKKTLGLEYNVAQELARELLFNQVSKDLRSELNEEVYQQKQSSPLIGKAYVAQQKGNLIQKIKDSLSTKLGRYLKILNTSSTTEAQQNSIEQLESLVDEFAKKDDVQSLFRYVETGLRETDAMLNRLRKYQSGEFKATARRLKNINDYLQSYSHAEEIRNLLELDADLDGKFREETLSKEDKTTLLDALNQVIENHSKVASLYRQQSKVFLANQYAKRDGRVHAVYRERFRKEFDKNNKRSQPLVGKPKLYVNGEKVGEKDYKQARQEYVNSQVADNKQDIIAEERQHWLNLFDLGPTDLGFGEAYIMDPSNINNDLVQIAHDILEKADFRAMSDAIEKFKTADELFVDFKKVKSESNQKKKYDELIENEVDEKGNTTGSKSNYMVGKYYSKVYDIDNDYYNRAQKAEDEGDLSKAEEITEEHNKWRAENTKKIAGQYVPIDKWKNPQFTEMQALREEDSIIAEMYDHILKLRMETDSDYADIHGLNRQRWGAKFYKLPSINAGNIERIMDKGFTQTIWQNLKDLHQIRSDNTEFRPEQVNETGSKEEKLSKEMKRVIKAMGDESGSLQQSIPVYFRGEIDQSDQSYDLLSIHLLDNAMATNYKEKSMIHADVEMIKDLSASRDVIKNKNVFTKGWHRMINVFTGEDQSPIKEKGENTQAHKALISLIESRLYGIKKKGDPTVNKWVDNILSWTGDVMLIGNYLSASANLMQGKTMNWIESIGGTEFDKKDLIAAEKKYWADMPSWSKDFGRRRFFSKTNLLIEEFDAFGDWSPVARRFVEDTRLKQKMKKNTLHGLNSMAEHYIQSSAMYAILNNIKVKDKNGKFLGRNDDGKIIIVDSIKDAMSLDEAYNIQSGRLVLNERVKYTTQAIDQSEEFGSEQIEDIHSLIRDINADLQGQYDSKQQSQASRTVWGRSFFMLRRWLPRGWMKRFRGGSTIGLSPDEVRLEERFYSRAKGEFKSGIYSDTFRLVWNKKLISRLREDGIKASWELMKTNWNQMNEQEYANVRRGLSEFAMMVTMVSLAAITKGLIDDEDDEYTKQGLYYVAFLQRRLYSEMVFYINPRETIRIMRSPAASLSLVENSIHLLDQLWKDFPYVDGAEQYERGSRKGQYKLRKDVEDIMPIFNQLNRNVEEALGWLYQDSQI